MLVRDVPHRTFMNTIHPFEKAGLGLAPFRFTGMSKNVISHGDGITQPGGTCDFCGEGIMWECYIRAADGKIFKVGNVCVAKTNDPSITDPVQRAVKKMQAD